MLNSYDIENKNSLLSYGKAKGIIQLINFLPKISPFEQILLVENKRELYAAMNFLQNKKFIYRQDAPIGTQLGKNLPKTEVFSYFDAIKYQNEKNVLLLITTKTELPKRDNSFGGFSVSMKKGQDIRIDFTGKGFDSRELTNGIAAHESYSIPWNEVLFVNKAEKMNKFLAKKVTENEYERDRESRIEYLQKCGFSDLQSYSSVPTKYIPTSNFTKTLVLNEILYPMFVKMCDANFEKEYWITGIITENMELCPFEISCDERVMHFDVNKAKNAFHLGK